MDSLDNLLEETINKLEQEHKTIEDVQFVSDGTTSCTWEEFTKLANKDYDCWHGRTYVNEKLVVVGVDWWLERGEYDGAEWWEFKTLPQKPTNNGGVICVWEK